MNISESLRGKQLTWIVAIVAIIWFALPGYRDLIDPDEGRYAEIPREMVDSGDWLTPRLNGFKYFEKPPLQYWMTAVSLSLFGNTNGAARLWVILIAFLGAVWTFYLGYRLFGADAGLYAFLILCSSLMYQILGHLITLDMAVGVFLAMGIGALLLAQSDRDNRRQVRNWMLTGWVALALATLTKGLIGFVLPGIALVLYTFWQRDWALWKHLHLGKGLLLFFAITAPWFILVSRANPEFAEFFFIQEHLERYTSPSHHRAEPWWYFLPLFVVGAMPWIWNSLLAIVRPGFSDRVETGNGFDAVRFLWIYILGMVLFFSAGSSKLPPYILPLYPALALLVGRHLAGGASLWGSLLSFAVTLIVFLIGAATVTSISGHESPQALLAYRSWILAAGAVMAIGLVVGLVWRHQTRKAVISLAISALLAMQVLGWGFQTQAGHRSSHELADVIKSEVGHDVPVYNVDSFFHSLPFYLGREVTLVSYQGELEMGIQQQPQKWLRNWQEFSRQWQAAEQAVAIFDMKSYPAVYQARMEKLPMRVIYQDPLKIVMVRK